MREHHGVGLKRIYLDITQPIRECLARQRQRRLVIARVKGCQAQAGLVKNTIQNRRLWRRNIWILIANTNRRSDGAARQAWILTGRASAVGGPFPRGRGVEVYQECPVGVRRGLRGAEGQGEDDEAGRAAGSQARPAL